MIGIVILGIAAFGLFGAALLGGVSKAQKKAEESATEALDAAFDGAPTVTFKINLQTPKYETVVVGAKERGYTLVHQADEGYGAYTLIFEKRDF